MNKTTLKIILCDALARRIVDNGTVEKSEIAGMEEFFKDSLVNMIKKLESAKRCL